jgi:hypothetical protein
MIELGSGGQKVENHFVGADQMVEIGRAAQRSRKTVTMSDNARAVVIPSADFDLKTTPFP